MNEGRGAIDRLAMLYGVQSSFVGTDGVDHPANEDVVLALLRALGAPIDGAADVPGALRTRRKKSVTRFIEPVLVHRIGQPFLVIVTLPERIDPRHVWITLTLEDTDIRRGPLVPAVIGMSPGDKIDGQRYYRFRVDLAGMASDPIPPGYHLVTVETNTASADEGADAALLISAPTCPEAHPGWGVFMPLHALRSSEDWGTGSYTDLAELGEWVGSLGGSMVGGLPLYPAFLSPPADPSPYRPVSRLAYNELFINPAVLPEVAQAPEARRLLNDDAFTARIATTRKSSLVEYEEVAQLRRSVLEPMAHALFANSSPRRAALDEFSRAHPELVAYAQFRAALERTGRDRMTVFTDMPTDMPTDGRADQAATGYHLYCQWTAMQQLTAAGDALSLYADFPIGVHPGGFDPYWSPASFVKGVSGGAPPDLFFRGGQDWGFPPLHPQRIREDGYHYLVTALRRAFRHAGCLRIDHIMGLQRLYMIPDGADVGQGAYVSYASRELHALVSLEAHRAGAVVVGEDLGTVPPEVRPRMAADRMLRSWVFQFESSAELPLPTPSRRVLASLGTHDLPRFAAHLWGTDIDQEEDAGRLSAEEAAAHRLKRELYRLDLFEAVEASDLTTTEATAAALRGCLTHLAASEADLLLVDLEELWGERQPQNRPGTGTEADNWRRRGARTLAEARADEGIKGLLTDINHLRIGAMT